MKLTRSVIEGGRSTALSRELSLLSIRPRSRVVALVWFSIRKTIASEAGQ